MGNSQGWIRLHRQITETPEWLSEPFTRGQAWVDLLLLANYETGFIRRRGILVAVERGQVGYSVESLAERWKWSKGKALRFFQELTDRERICRKIAGTRENTAGSGILQRTIRKTVPKKSSVSILISLVNYERYQVNDTEDGTEDGPKTVLEQRRIKRKIFLSDSIEYRLSKRLLEAIRRRNPKFKEPNLQTWAKHIDRMVRLDSRSIQDIEAVIDWCQADPFWQSNILSTEKLRKQFDQLMMKMDSNGGGIRKAAWEL